MYGTVMIGRSSATLDDLRPLFDAWVDAIGREAGFIDERILADGEGRIVMCVRFRDEAAYKALADNPGSTSGGPRRWRRCSRVTRNGSTATGTTSESYPG